ncbi:MAG: ABC transporter substrate-binding protein, partial [Pseudomonadota bacterium]
MKDGLITGVVAGALTATAVWADTPPDTMVMAYNIDAISTFDPAQIGEVVTNEIILNTCDSLVEIDPADESQVRPRLADSWEVSDDGLVITFNLNPDAVFPSGNPVTAADTVWSMQRVLELGFGNSASLTDYGFTLEANDTQFVAIDDHTFQMTLSKPYPTALIMQAVAANRVANTLDRVYLEDKAVDGDYANGYLTTNTACVGPYKLVRWNAGEVVILEANEGYYGPAPKTKRWLMRHVPEAGAQRLLLEQGDVDVARDLGSEDIRDMTGTDGLEFVSARKHQLLYMGFDSGQERFADDRVRLAFKYLINYDALAETVMAFDGVPRNSVVPIGAYGALDEEEGQPFSLDFDKARELLAEAGYADGFEARLFIGSAPYSAAVAQHVQANAAEVGVTLNIEQMANAQLFSAFRGRDFDTVMLGWSTSVPHAHGMLSRHAVNPDNSEEAKLTMFPTWRAQWFRPEFNEKVEAA